ncbi:MAG: EAL domain-containing protein [Acidimicrobiales bacterium]|nr:EAL domain-containing protein [Acidimicrobiales bacterium]
MSRERTRSRKPAALALSAALVAATTTAWLAVRESAEERRVAVAALDVQLATTHLTSSDSIADDHPHDLAHLSNEIATVDAKLDVALHSLDGREQALARADAEELLTTARQVVAGALPETELGSESHSQLQNLLATASGRAQEHSDHAMSIAGVAGATAMICCMALIWLFASGRRHATFRDRMVEAQQDHQRQILALLDNTPDAVLAVAADGSVVYSSAAAKKLIGDREQAVVADLYALVDGDQAQAFARHVDQAINPGQHQTFSINAVDGTLADFQLRVSVLEDPTRPLRVVTLRDVTSELRYKSELRRQARVDVLTGLPNRRMLEPAISRAQRVAIESAAEGHEACPHTLAMIDLDGFKEINDTLGHSVGDKVLTIAARRLASAVGESGFVLRLGGDEFAVVVPKVCDIGALEAFAQRVISAIAEPIAIAHRHETVRTSIGFATSTELLAPEELLRRADLALYEAKRSGGGTWRLFDDTMARRAEETTAMSRALRDADHANEFRLVYQPVVRADTTEVEFYEALLRWNSPDLGEVGPDRFIPVAETTGDIVAIGWWVIEEACRQVRSWRDVGMDPDLTVSVNVSPVQLEEPDFSDRVLELVSAWGVEPSSLIIEVTESGLVGQSGPPLDHLRRLREAGCRVAIDDFGSGYSNLGQMLGLPLDIIKVDRLLIDQLTSMRVQMGGDPAQPCTIMEAVVQIASALQAPVVAEGVEDAVQRHSLYESGVTLLQGFAFSRPVPPDEIVAMAGCPTAESYV